MPGGPSLPAFPSENRTEPKRRKGLTGVSHQAGGRVKTRIVRRGFPRGVRWGHPGLFPRPEEDGHTRLRQSPRKRTRGRPGPRSLSTSINGCIVYRAPANRTLHDALDDTLQRRPMCM